MANHVKVPRTFGLIARAARLAAAVTQVIALQCACQEFAVGTAELSELGPAFEEGGGEGGTSPQVCVDSTDAACAAKVLSLRQLRATQAAVPVQEPAALPQSAAGYQPAEPHLAGQRPGKPILDTSIYETLRTLTAVLSKAADPIGPFASAAEATATHLWNGQWQDSQDAPKLDPLPASLSVAVEKGSLSKCASTFSHVNLALLEIQRRWPTGKIECEMHEGSVGVDYATYHERRNCIKGVSESMLQLTTIVTSSAESTFDCFSHSEFCAHSLSQAVRRAAELVRAGTQALKDCSEDSWLCTLDAEQALHSFLQMLQHLDVAMSMCPRNVFTPARSPAADVAASLVPRIRSNAEGINDTKMFHGLVRFTSEASQGLKVLCTGQFWTPVAPSRIAPVTASLQELGSETMDQLSRWIHNSTCFLATSMVDLLDSSMSLYNMSAWALCGMAACW